MESHLAQPPRGDSGNMAPVMANVPRGFTTLGGIKRANSENGFDHFKAK